MCYLMTATGAANWTVNVVHPWLLLTWMVPSILVTSFCEGLAQASPTCFRDQHWGHDKTSQRFATLLLEFQQCGC